MIILNLLDKYKKFHFGSVISLSDIYPGDILQRIYSLGTDNNGAVVRSGEMFFVSENISNHIILTSLVDGTKSYYSIVKFNNLISIGNWIKIDFHPDIKLGQMTYINRKDGKQYGFIYDIYYADHTENIYDCSNFTVSIKGDKQQHPFVVLNNVDLKHKLLFLSSMIKILSPMLIVFSIFATPLFKATGLNPFFWYFWIIFLMLFFFIPEKHNMLTLDGVFFYLSHPSRFFNILRNMKESKINEFKIIERRQ